MTLTEVRRPAPGNRKARLLDERAAAGIALGVAGLFMFNIICGPFAIGLGISALRRATPRSGAAGRTGRARRAAALVSIALGVADLVLLAVLAASRVRSGQFSWHAG